MNKKSGIILEGGAMRSMFSAGILDFFMDSGIEIPNVLAISAGAYAGMNYVSGQKGRVIDAVIKPLEQEKYLGLGTFLKKGTFFDMNLLFDEIPKNRVPFDFESFSASSKRLVTSTVNCLTGETCFHEKFEDMDDFPDKNARECEIERTITEALLVHPATEYVREFNFDYSSGAAIVTFVVKGYQWEEEETMSTNF